MNTKNRENFIELITNNGFCCLLDNGIMTLYGSLYATIMIGNTNYNSTTLVKFHDLQNFMTFEDAKEYFIDRYIGSRKIAVKE